MPYKSSKFPKKLFHFLKKRKFLLDSSSILEKIWCKNQWIFSCFLMKNDRFLSIFGKNFSVALDYKKSFSLQLFKQFWWKIHRYIRYLRITYHSVRNGLEDWPKIFQPIFQPNLSAHYLLLGKKYLNIR